MILWGAAAAGVPVVIHLLMRPKPRTVTLPTMRFVLKSHNANLSKQRIKRLILLLMRMGAVALVAMLLAGFYLQGKHFPGAQKQPVAMVVVVDNSASMSYTHKSRTLLKRGQQIAAEIVESLPKGSRIAVISTDKSRHAAGFLNDPQYASLKISDTLQAHGAGELGGAIMQAAGMLRDSNLPRKEVLIISDMTNASWSQLGEMPPTKNIAFTIIDCGITRDANISLGRVKLSSRSVPFGVGVTLQTIVSSRNLGGEMNLLVELDGQNIDQRSVELPVGGSRAVNFTIYPSKTGVLHGRVVLQNSDPMQVDNVRHFTIEVRESAEILFVTSPTSKDDKTAFLMGCAIAPPTPRSEAGILTKRTVTPDQLNAAMLANAPLVVLPNTATLTEQQWKNLHDYAMRGGRIWIVAGSMLSVGSYNSNQGQQVMPVKLAGQRELTKPIGFQAPDTTIPMFAVFADPENPPLGDVTILRRFKIESVAPGADCVLKFTDGTPAIIVGELGKGQVVFWNFSPARSWSNLGRLGAQLVVLTDSTLENLLDLSAAADGFFDVGENIDITIPENQRSPTATIRKSGSKTTTTLDLDLRRGSLTISPDKPGGYRVDFADAPADSSYAFSTNVPESQSDLQKTPKRQVTGKFPRGRVSVITSLEDRETQIIAASQKLELLPIILVVLLVLLTVESFFANRFYKQPAADKDVE
ncbi:MAG: BatA and WFA domain-containing protein [Phycisphaerae bacterium]|nr:BatA and WFA domain-containing protein [Phycisphaerae bacterium]